MKRSSQVYVKTLQNKNGYGKTFRHKAKDLNKRFLNFLTTFGR